MRKVGKTIYLEYSQDELKELLKIPKGQIVNVAPVTKDAWSVEVDVMNEEGWKLPDLKEEEPKKKEMKKETKRLLEEEEDDEETIEEEDEDEF